MVSWRRSRTCRLGVALGLVLLAAAPGAVAEQAGSDTLSFQAGQVDVGDLYSCAVLAGGTIDCWGWNRYGQLATTTNNATNNPNPTPTQVPGITTARAISAGNVHTCALLASGTIDCWGDNNQGELGNATNNGVDTANPTPTQVPGITTARAISANGTQSSGSHTCALLADGTIDCWGSNNYGELANTVNNTTANPNPTPTPVPGIATARAISAGANHTCAVLANGTVDCWGQNLYGQLGITTNSGTNNANPVPTPVPGITTARAISAGGRHTCVLLASGTIDCFGINHNGELANVTNNGVDTANPTPVTVPGVSTARALTAGGSHTCALLADGSLDCWGYNRFGGLGNATNNGTDNPTTTPTAVAGVTTARAVTAGGNFTCALLAAGTVDCWGVDAHGQLGYTSANSANPVPAGTSPALSVAALAADLSVVAIPSVATATVGDPVTVAVTVANSGPDSAPATNLVALDLPAGLGLGSTTPSQGTYDAATGIWSVGAIGATAQATLTLHFTVQTAGDQRTHAEITRAGIPDPDSIPDNGQSAGEDDYATATMITAGAAGPSGPTGSQGPAGVQGPAGPTGAQGPAGRIQLVVCRTVTITTGTGTHKKKRKVQKCTTKLVSGVVKFTTTTGARVTLSRAGHVYARGTVRHGKLRLQATRTLRPGRYVLTVATGGRYTRQTVTLR